MRTLVKYLVALLAGFVSMLTLVAFLSVITIPFGEPLTGNVVRDARTMLQTYYGEVSYLRLVIAVGTIVIAGVGLGFHSVIRYLSEVQRKRDGPGDKE